MAQLYSVSPSHFEREHKQIIEACLRQGIGHITVIASITGKLLGTQQQLKACRKIIEDAGLRASVMVFAIGHPAMARYYSADGKPPTPALHHTGPMLVEKGSHDADLLPADWQYGINEFGNPVYCCSCPNDAWLRDNITIAATLAEVFDEIWYDDEYRMDGDQAAGTAHRSTAVCYCDRCMEAVSKRVRRKVTRDEVVKDKELHAVWTDYKTDLLANGMGRFQEAARRVNPKANVALMVRWGGEERDGIDLAKLLPKMGPRPKFRAGEGHFGAKEYFEPMAQAMEYLACSYHVSWFPQDSQVLSETTYFAPMPQHDVLKKAALALAAGADELAYCPCVDGWVLYQWIIEHAKPLVDECIEAFCDKTAMFQPVSILRTAAAGQGDSQPTQRVLDRQYFPLFTMAGLNSTVVRQGGWRDRPTPVLAVTGRSAWDFDLSASGSRTVVFDGTALMENSSLNGEIGVKQVHPANADGEIEVDGSFQRDGMLLRSGNRWIIPFLWHKISAEKLPLLLNDIRRVFGPMAGSAWLEGDLDVILAHYRFKEHDSLMLVNMSPKTRRVKLNLSAGRTTCTTWRGAPMGSSVALGPNEIRVLKVH